MHVHVDRGKTKNSHGDLAVKRKSSTSPLMISPLYTDTEHHVQYHVESRQNCTTQLRVLYSFTHKTSHTHTHWTFFGVFDFPPHSHYLFSPIPAVSAHYYCLFSVQQCFALSNHPPRQQYTTTSKDIPNNSLRKINMPRRGQVPDL
jgi:hypothetical protein